MSAPQSQPAQPSELPQPVLVPAVLPLAQLESLKFKLVQTMESIRGLQATVHAGGQPFMVTWPEILTKYNVILSHTHTLFNSLSNTQTATTAAGSISGAGISTSNTRNPLAHLALHPTVTIPEGQPDLALSSLMRMMRLPDVLSADKDTVAQIREMVDGTRGPGGGTSGLGGLGSGETDEEVLSRIEQIRSDHDGRVVRGLRAVQMLKEQYDWRVRVEPGAGVYEGDEGYDGFPSSSASESDSEQEERGVASQVMHGIESRDEDQSMDEDEGEEDDMEDAVVPMDGGNVGLGGMNGLVSYGDEDDEMQLVDDAGAL
ncbi:hypothetical protein BOTBODRAFT_179151 [Botryobasidium botryosum FD-172 SS1]|uniref:Mediator complex subunit 8 n=1 Tax=Botryobasidium botryosum (strain FD-172 SS1) TaxID=930990 RepID=A0A067M0N0_BOTB1|nr:hypothetical protein BOTBODRAFT_179151 [Botryobasidium botryosum FD-172 SS1]